MRRDDAELAGGEGESNVRKPHGKTAGESRVMDREVPLSSVPDHAALHDWLDGEIEQSRARDAEGTQQVELWTRINAETDMLRRRTTPIYVQQAIMSALPDQVPSASRGLWARASKSRKTVIVITAAVVAATALAVSFLR
jgi:hypothetical protein